MSETKWLQDLLLKEQIYNTKRWIQTYKIEQQSIVVYFGSSTVVILYSLLTVLKYAMDISVIMLFVFLFIISLTFTIGNYILYGKNITTYKKELLEKEKEYDNFLKDTQ